MYVAVSPIVQQYFDKKRTLVSGLTIAGFSFGSIIFPLLTRYSVDLLGWRGTLVLYSAITMQNVWLCALHRPFLKQYGSSESSDEISARCFYMKNLIPLDILKRPSYLMFAFTSFAVNVNVSVYMFHIVNKCLSDGLGKYQAAFVPLVGGVIEAVFGPVVGMLASIPFLRMKKVCLCGLTAAGLGLFLMLLGVPRTFTTIIIAVGLLSICKGESLKSF